MDPTLSNDKNLLEIIYIVTSYLILKIAKTLKDKQKAYKICILWPFFRWKLDIHNYLNVGA